MMRTVFAGCLFLCLVQFAWALFDLYELREAEIVVIGTVAPEQPARCTCFIEMDDGSRQGSGKTYCVYEVSDIIPIKGNVPSAIRVLGMPNVDDGTWGRNYPGVMKQWQLPLGKRVLLYLQRVKGGRFDLENDMRTYGGQWIDAPEGVEFATYYFHLDLPRFVLADGVDYRRLMKGDRVAYDVARAFAVSISAPDTELARHGELEGLWRLALNPTWHSMQTPAHLSPSNARAREMVSTNPYEFFVREILPRLPAPTTAQEALVLDAVAGSWGDLTAPNRIVSRVLELGNPSDRVVLDTTQSAAGLLAFMSGGRELCERLLESPVKRIVLVGIHLAARGSQGQQHRSRLLTLLRSTDDEELQVELMRSLSTIDKDKAHFPKFGEEGGFAPGSHNARCLEYWRSRE